MITEINNAELRTPNSSLPSGWRWVRLGEVCEINPSRPKNFYRASDAPTTFVPMAVVNEKTGTTARPEIVPYKRVSKGYTFFEEGDVLFAKITPCMQNGKHVIARNLIDGIGFGTTEFHVLRPRDGILSEWIWHFIRQPFFLQEAIVYFTGAVGQQRVPEEFLANYFIPLPLIEEQKRIATKLQELMQEVERVRAACEKQLEVARALPAVYLREVFESEEAIKWERKKLGEVCKVITGSTPRTDDPTNWDGDIPWATPNDMGKLASFTIEDTERKISEKGFKSCSTKLLSIGSILLTTRAPIGHLAINLKPMCTNQGFKSFIPSSRIHNWFLFFSLKHFVPVLQSMGRGQTFTEISKKRVENFEIPLPPLLEQKRIATSLKEKMEYVENLQSTIGDQIEVVNALPQSSLAVRPGSVPEIEDRIVTYAIIYLIAPYLDKKLPEGVYSYRLKPERTRDRLFHDHEILQFPFLKKRTIREMIDIVEPWYGQWPIFVEKTKYTFEEKGYNYLAISDIVSYFENISLEILRDEILLKHLPKNKK
jgi:type I restriction enzyme S subunit